MSEQVSLPTQAGVVAPNRQAIRLRLNSRAVIGMLLVQYVLGMIVNLYSEIPARDQHRGFLAAVGRALTGRPTALLLHAVLGLALVVAATRVLVRGWRSGHRTAALTATLGFIAIVAAAASGATYVDQGHASASLSMALLTVVAVGAYAATAALARHCPPQGPQP